MFNIRRFLLRLLSFFRTGRAESDLVREINAHLQLLEDRFVAQGMTPEDARYAARRAFGGVERAKEHQRDARSFGSIDAWRLDLKLGFRMLVKYPGLTLVGGLGLAVAIAIVATSFALVYGAIHPTLPLDEGERIVGLENWDTSWNNQEHSILHDFVTWRAELTAVQDLGAFRMIQRNLITPDGRSEEVSAAEITASGFRVARVPPLLGRPILEQDENKGAPAVAVLGYEVWRTRFGADPGILGQNIRLGERVHTVVGIMPDGFAFPVNQRLWMALQADPSDYARRQGPGILVFGRLAPGATIDEAQTELTAIGARAAAAFPETHERLRPRVVRYTELWFDDGDRSQLHIVQMVLTMLVVLVGVNVAILVYARTAMRAGEIAVRIALGASRRRVIGQLFVEALVLSAVAAAAGLALAWLALQQANEAARVFGAIFGGFPFWMRFQLSAGTVVYTAGVAVLAAAITGVVPAIKATGPRPTLHLAQLTGGASLRLGWIWTALIVLQVAFAVAVLPPAADVAWQSIRLAAAGPGFAAEEYILAGIVMEQDDPLKADAGGYQSEFERRYRQQFAELRRRVESEPGVLDVTVTSTRPGNESAKTIEVEASGRHPVRVLHVGVDFFDAFDVPLLTGRPFGSGDVGATAIIVNHSFVSEVLGGADALGRRLRYVADNAATNEPARWHDIVAVVGDFPATPALPGRTQARLYHPVATGDLAARRLAVHVRPDGREAFESRLRAIAAAVDPTLRIRREPDTDLDDLGMIWGGSAFAVVTLCVVLLAAAGIHALMSFTVTRRRKEIAIRMALGADRGRILRTIFSRALLQLAMGVLAGLAIASPLLGSEGNHAIFLPGGVAFITLVGLVAALGPARRALRFQPIDTLREE